MTRQDIAGASASRQVGPLEDPLSAHQTDPSCQDKGNGCVMCREFLSALRLLNVDLPLGDWLVLTCPGRFKADWRQDSSESKLSLG